MPSFTTWTPSTTRESRGNDALVKLRAGVESLLSTGLAYSELSVERISSAAGISRSSFYRYVEDKGELLRRLAIDVNERSLAASLAFWQLPPSASHAEVATALSRFVLVCWDGRLIRNAVVHATSYDETIREHHERVLNAAIEMIAAHIATGQAEGWVREGMDPHDVASWLVHMADHGLVTIVGTAEAAALPEISASLLSIIWNTLYDGRRDPAGGPLASA